MARKTMTTIIAATITSLTTRAQEITAQHADGTLTTGEALTHLAETMPEAIQAGKALDEAIKRCREAATEIAVSDIDSSTVSLPTISGELAAGYTRTGYNTRRLDRLLAKLAQEHPEYAAELAACREETTVKATYRFTLPRAKAA